jgi:hypothetical protein
MTRTTASGCWPTAVQEQLLRAALFDGASAVAAWDAWQRSSGHPRIDEGSVRLLPLVYRNLARLEVSGPLMADLKGIHRRSWYRNQVLFREVGRVLTMLKGAGIETLLLKGVPLALTCYPDEGSRPMADADVLVRPADLKAAVDVVGRVGWRPVPEPLAWPAEPRNAWTFFDAGDRQLDLHWRVFRVGAAPDDDLWDASQAIDVAGVAARALSPSDLLLHILAHGVVWNPVPSIRWVADAALVVRARGAAIDWDRLGAEAERRRLVPTVERGLRYLVEQMEVPVPASALARFSHRRFTRRERVALWAQMQPGVAAGALRVWFDYVEYERSAGRRPGPLRFGEYLRAFWQIEPGRGLPAMVADRIRHRAREPTGGR